MSLERLSNDAVHGESLLALEHRHRYRFAARFCAGRRVVDLCCGVGYGSAILAEQAASVLGLDVDPRAVEEARRAHGALDGVRFDQADAVTWLGTVDPSELDVLVCFEGIEHLADGEAVLDGLRRLAAGGVRLLVSVPNSRRYEEDNAFHLTNFDRDAVGRWAAALDAVVLGQWHAEGVLIAPEDGADADPAMLESPGVPAGERPRGWAMHYLLLVGLEPAGVPGGMLAWVAEPVNARWQQSLERANRELWQQNVRIGTGERPSAFGAASAAVLDRWRARAETAERALLDVADREARVAQEEARVAGRAAALEQREAALATQVAERFEDERRVHALRQRIAEQEAELLRLRAVRQRRAVRMALGAAALARRLRGPA
ncbi:methyltransferase domain-containing protein [Patulibacter brassicae]|uniref:Methyltransferase domain-containing protein n=1 Tax=Patulibacter brassicae TaxID=1705717 RepID=A0ABU4VIH4_9ACTN|nr:methyltransferase domain-containing protein [Patulibacter brassicae]MDX8151646.1 methyltransferase domain-containing protein [Patulibacter brassicae]